MIWKLIALDWRAEVLYAKLILILVPFSLIMMGVITSQMFVLLHSTWIALCISISTFETEKTGALENLLLTLPVKRKQIVTARYVHSLLGFASCTLLGLIIIPITRHFSRLQWWIGVEGHIRIIIVCALIFSLFHVFMFPLLFKYGYKKARIVGVYIPAILMYLCTLALNRYVSVSERNVLLDFVVFARENLLLFGGIVGGIAVAVMLISYWLSLRVFLRRDI